MCSMDLEKAAALMVSIIEEQEKVKVEYITEIRAEKTSEIQEITLQAVELKEQSKALEKEIKKFKIVN